MARMTFNEYKRKYRHKQRHFNELLNEMRRTDTQDLIEALEMRIRNIIDQ